MDFVFPRGLFREQAEALSNKGPRIPLYSCGNALALVRLSGSKVFE